MRLTGGVLKLKFKGDTLANGDFGWGAFEPNDFHSVGIAESDQFLCARVTRFDQRSQCALNYPLAFGADIANGPLGNPIAEQFRVVLGDVVEIIGDGFADIV